MTVERQGLVIYYNNDATIKYLRKDIRIHYLSKKNGYAVVYYNKSHEDDIMKSLKTNQGIAKIEKIIFNMICIPLVNREYNIGKKVYKAIVSFFCIFIDCQT